MHITAFILNKTCCGGKSQYCHTDPCRNDIKQLDSNMRDDMKQLDRKMDQLLLHIAGISSKTLKVCRR